MSSRAVLIQQITDRKQAAANRAVAEREARATLAKCDEDDKGLDALEGLVPAEMIAAGREAIAARRLMAQGAVA